METIIFGIKLAVGLVIGLIGLILIYVLVVSLICRVFLFFQELSGEFSSKEKQEEITLGSDTNTDRDKNPSGIIIAKGNSTLDEAYRPEPDNVKIHPSLAYRIGMWVGRKRKKK
jgi:hypothetical protein